MSASDRALPAHYRNFHLWMLLPFVISLVGFSYSYYLNLSKATFHQHVHGISATLWYVLVVVQPWLITRKLDIRNHRALGAVGTLLAGMVAGSAYALIPRNIDDVAQLNPNGFFNPTFAWFAVIIDFVLVSLFVASVVLAIFAMKRRDLAGHVQWMMASVFFVLSPALGRMMGIGMIAVNKGDITGISLVGLAVPAMVVMLALIVVYFRRYGSFRHPAFWLLVAGHAPYLFVEPIGNNVAIQTFLAAVFKA
jgi:hypothetical protein